MVRPKIPLISKEAAIAAALSIIDEHGVEKLSLRNLGSALGVHGMSLYHFTWKDSILVVARHAPQRHSNASHRFGGPSSVCALVAALRNRF